MRDHTVLWTSASAGLVRTCVMVSCCSGAELQLHEGGEIVLRELYPDKSSLYERARAMQQERELAVAVAPAR